MKRKRSEYKGFYGPFCIHFYRNSYADFPIVKGPFEFIEDALICAQEFNDFQLVRLGCWTNRVMKNGYYRLIPLDVQVSLL